MFKHLNDVRRRLTGQCLTTFFFNYFEVCLALYFWFFLGEGYLLLLTFKLIDFETFLTLKANSVAYSEPCQTSKMQFWGKQGTAFSFLLFLQKAPSQMFGRVLNSSQLPLVIFAKVLPTCFLKLIDIFLTVHQEIQYYAQSNSRDLIFNIFVE